MKRANDSERATLRLEVEKLRRVEGEWLQVLVRMLDHVYALHQGASRSGQPKLAEQVGSFQMACRDSARRVGLAPFTANEGEPFDAQRHQLVEEGATAPADAVVAETIATGYTFQGRLVRPALVRLRDGEAAVAAVTTDAGPEEQSRLPLEAADTGPE
jgi:molecular chaperone GrpE (heat shock protein)